MKKHLLISLLLCGIILSGCSQQIDSQNKVFENKLECIKFKKGIEIDLANRLPINDEYGNKDGNIYLHEIFYSNLLNSCVYYGERTMGENQDFIIVDYLQNKEITSIGGYNKKDENDHGYEIVLKKLKELKGE